MLRISIIKSCLLNCIVIENGRDLSQILVLNEKQFVYGFLVTKNEIL